MRQITFKFIIMTTLIYLGGLFSNAFARSPLGIGAAEQPINNNSFFSEFYFYILMWQQTFERTIGGYLITIKDHPHNAIWLISLSFIYGILHAAGPGHGKAVISSYLIANNASLKRGIFLSFLSSILQALTAIIIILMVFFLLPGRLTQATNFLTIGSFILVMILGILMIWRKMRQYMQQTNKIDKVFVTTQPIENNQLNILNPTPSKASNLTQKPRLNYEKNGINHAFNGVDNICIDCGQAHMVSVHLANEPLKLRSTLMAVFSIGLRPCSGAIFIMSYAMLNNLLLIGMFSVLAMALGTFITVSLLAVLAVYAKSVAFKISNRKKHFSSFTSFIEWIAAIFIFITGLSLTLTAIIS